MAENSDGQERSEEPTGKRLSEAREKGQVPRSRELSTVAALLASGALFLGMGDTMLRALLAMLHRALSLDRNDAFDPVALTGRLSETIFEALWAVAPLMALMAIVAVIGNIALSGWNFSTQAMQPKPEKLNPVTGLAKVLSWRGLVEMLKSLAKFILIASVAILWLQAMSGEFLGLGREPLPQAMAHMGDLLLWAFIVVSATLILVALVDIPFQLWDHKKQLKMTQQEVKEENKQTQGNPEVKGKQKQLQMQMAMRRMMAEVPKADVVVTNPTHYAVALRYEQGEMDAPKLVAKGSDAVAARIRELAEENGVPILSAPPLARALYHSTELDEYVPAGLYRAVAQVLAYVYHLGQGPVYDRSGSAANFDDLPIPEELRRDR